MSVCGRLRRARRSLLLLAADLPSLPSFPPPSPPHLAPLSEGPRLAGPPGGAAGGHSPWALPARDEHDPLLCHCPPGHAAAQPAAWCAGLGSVLGRGGQPAPCKLQARLLPHRPSHPPSASHPTAGALLFFEIKHWKGDKRAFSTLAWSAAPLDRLVDFGQHSARVRREDAGGARVQGASCSCCVVAPARLPAACSLLPRSPDRCSLIHTTLHSTGARRPRGPASLSQARRPHPAQDAAPVEPRAGPAPERARRRRVRSVRRAGQGRAVQAPPPPC